MLVKDHLKLGSGEKLYPMKPKATCPECKTVFPLPINSKGEVINYGRGRIKRFCKPQCRSDFGNRKHKYNIDNLAMRDINGLVNSIQSEWMADTKITDGWIRLKIGAYIDKKIEEGKKIYKP